MPSPRFEVAEVLSRYKDDCVTLSLQQQRVLRDLVACRTAALGAHVQQCDACGHEEISYNSCRNRHCPKCQGQKQAAWLDAQCDNLLGVPYYHIVFTLPEALGPLALQNKSILYGLLFRSAAETLLTIALDPKHLGARIGFTAVLHTWGQTLTHHPHLHCVVPAGGLSGDRGSPKGRGSPKNKDSPVDEQRWISARENFFLSVRVLSRLFRAKYLAYLREAYRSGELVLAGRLKELADPGAWRDFLEPLQQIDWVVYAKPPFGSPEQVLKYLARYTHRIAISNHRLLSIEGGIVAFRYKDYRRGRQDRVMRLSATEFIRRFMLHLLPRGFVRIRHYGLLANRYRKENLALCRRLLASALAVQPESSTEPAAVHEKQCPVCKKGHMIFVARFGPPSRAPPLRMNTLCYA